MLCGSLTISDGAIERVKLSFDSTEITRTIYIPEKDILEHVKGLLPFIEQKATGFNRIYRDALIRAQDIPTNNQTETQKRIGEKIAGIIGGYIEWGKVVWHRTYW